MMKIGFIGLGTMGRHMAANLARAGFQLIVYNRDRSKTEGFGPSVTVANSVVEAALQSDLLFTMLTDDNAVKQVYLGEDGIVAALRGQKGASLAIDCSTVSPETTLAIAASLAEIGVDLLDAPVTGSEPQAREQKLTFIVGGQKALYEKCQPLFAAMGQKAVYIGEQGAGAKVKLANNLLVAVTLAGLSESMTLVRKSGIDPTLFLEVVSGGGARSGMAEMKGPKMLAGDYSPQFMTRLMLKDLKLAGNFAEAQEVPMPAFAAVKELFQMACSSGYGDEDMSAIIKCYEQWAGLGE